MSTSKHPVAAAGASIVRVIGIFLILLGIPSFDSMLGVYFVGAGLALVVGATMKISEHIGNPEGHDKI